MSQKNLLASASALGIVLAIVPAFAQEFDPGSSTYLGSIYLDGGDGINADSIAAAATAGSRVPVDLSRLPREVTVITADRAEKQGARTFEEAISYSAGVSTEAYGQDGRYESYSIRGFESQLGGTYRDGMPLRLFGWAGSRTEMYGMESVNVLRGPTSDLYGANSPGGLINAVSKRPEFSFGAELRSEIATDEGYELSFDVTGPINDDVAYRLVGVWNESGTNYDAVDTSRIYLAPSLTWEPTADTKINLFAQYQSDEVGDTYVQVPANGSYFDNPEFEYGPDTYTGNPDNNTIEAKISYVGYEFEHRLDDSFTLVSRARLSSNKWDYSSEFPSAYYNNEGQAIAATPYFAPFLFPGFDPTAVDTSVLSKFTVDQEVIQLSFDYGLRYEFERGETNGSLIFGVDYYEADSDTDYAFGYAGVQNLQSGEFGDDPGFAALFPDDLPAVRDEDIEQTGIYASGFIEFGESWTLSGGLRHDWLLSKIDQVTTVLDPVTFSTSLEGLEAEVYEQFTSANIGLAHHFGDGYTAYGSVSRSFDLPPSGIDARTGGPLEVEKSDALELGLKYQSPDARTSFGIAAFEITKKNATFSDGVAVAEKTQAGEVRSRGIELEASHEFDNGFALYGTYTYTDAKVTKDTLYQGNKVPRVPEQAASIWATYELQSGGLQCTTLGLGARHTGKHFANAANVFEIDAVTLLDASITYEWGDWSAVVSGRNITDKEYVSYCTSAFAAIGLPAFDDNAGGCVWGAGRELALTLTRQF